MEKIEDTNSEQEDVKVKIKLFDERLVLNGINWITYYIYNYQNNKHDRK